MPSLPRARVFLSSERERTLDRDTEIVYALDAARTIVYFNPAYAAFCADNGGDLDRCGLGVSLASAIEAPFLQTFYTVTYARLFDTGEPWRTRYLCPSRTEARVFEMIVEPLRDASGRVKGLLVRNPLCEEHAAPAEAEPGPELELAGVVVMCSVCRRVQVPDSDRWVWAPAYLDPRARLSHGLCAACGEAYYGEST